MDAPRPGREGLPQRIGGYRIVRKLGEGGMGVVFEAEQEHPRRSVALKVLTGGLLLDDMRRRFELEAQVLGLLQHAAIAQIYAAGFFESATGSQPFFAMELIRGEPLVAYASKRNLGTRERLELIARISDGIQHAHQRGVIHRDLKPDNILVDSEGQPKILDFGIARATDTDIQAATLRTDVGQIMGTVPYMSPEQAAGDPGGIDARTDVYSLGVVAYQLVSGALPYKSDDPMLIEALRVVREEEARPLSTVNRALRGDVETIIGKALEKDRGRRYASASELAADIRRYLTDEPIRARPPSAAYHLRKFARRNRGLVLGLGGVFVALVVGLIGTAKGYVEARGEAARANQTSRFLRTILESVDPAVARGSDTTLLKAILDDTAARIGTELADQPLTEVEIRSTMTSAYFAISALEPALEQARAALALATRELGEDHPSTLVERRKVGSVLQRLERFGEAEESLTATLAASERALGSEDPITVSASCELGLLFLELERYEEAARQIEPVLRFRQRVRGPDHDETLVALNSLGVTYLYLGRFDEAQALLRESLAGWRRTKGETHPETIKAFFNLAACYSETGSVAEAEALYQEVVERNRRIAGDEHENTLVSQVNLAYLWRNQGRYAEAAELLGHVLEVRRRISGPEDPRTLELEVSLANVLSARFMIPEATALAQHAYEGLRRINGEEHLETVEASLALATIRHNAGDFERAVELRRSALEAVTRLRGEDHPLTLLVMSDLGVSCMELKRYEEAEPFVRRALAARRRTLGDQHRSTLQSLHALSVLCDAQGRFDEAVPLLGEFVPGWARLYGDRDGIVVEALAMLARDVEQLAELGPAEPALRVLVAHDERTLAPEAPRLAVDLTRLGQALVERFRAAEAVPFFERAESILLGAFERGEDSSDDELSELARHLVRLYEAWGKADEAAAWRE